MNNISTNPIQLDQDGTAVVAGTDAECLIYLG